MAVRLWLPPLAYMAGLHADADEQQRLSNAEADPALARVVRSERSRSTAREQTNGFSPGREEEGAGLPSTGGRQRAWIVWERPSGRCRAAGTRDCHHHVGVLGEHRHREQEERAHGAGQRRAPAAGVDALVAPAAVAQPIPCGLWTKRHHES